MNRISNKAAAEAVLRELPSVLGAYVSEDLEGYPREIHLLVRHGPDTAGLARDIRGLLEERLGIPIDQRVISIAQLAPDAEEEEEEPEPKGAPARGGGSAPAAEPARSQPPRRDMGRPIFAGLESTVSSGHAQVAVRLSWKGQDSRGVASAVDTPPGRARAAATATLRSAVEASWNRDLGLELDFASVVQALDGDYVLVSVLGMAGHLGRRPLPLVGAHPVESDVETAAALATLKAVNRILSVAVRPDED